MAQKGPVSTSYEIIILSRGTTLQLPNTQMMLYPPTTPPGASVDGCECLSPHQHAILPGRVCARWLISTDTHCLLFFFSVLCFSPPLLASYECILFTILSWTVPLASSYSPALTNCTLYKQPILNHPGLCPACQNKEWRPGRRALHGWRCYSEIRGSGSLVVLLYDALIALLNISMALPATASGVISH